MRAARHTVVVALALVVAFASRPVADSPAARQVPLYQQFLSNAHPLDIAAAKKVDRIAWLVYDEGKRNVYTAAAPAFTPVRLTSFLKDDGVDISDVTISDNGATVVFVRGTAPNREGWVANASANPDGPERAIWAVRTAGGAAWRVAEGGAPELAPDGSSVLFVKDDQIFRARVTPVRPVAERDRGEKPFIVSWGVESSPRWSPDGKKIAFVTTRTDHSFVAIYDMATRRITYMAPSVDFDATPLWSDDSKTIYFVRRPGLAFGQQSQQGGGGIGIPDGPAFTAQGRGGRGGANQGGEPPRIANIPGLARATFKGGHVLSLWKGDPNTGEASEVWHNQPNDPIVTNFSNPLLAGDRLVFTVNTRGGRGGGRGQRANQPEEIRPTGPLDEWERYYSIPLDGSNARPVMLTTTNGLIEDQTSVALSPDRKTLFYCTNADDIDRRHIWAVPVSGGKPWQVTLGQGIETRPVPLASGKLLATMSADWKMPQSIGIWRGGMSPMSSLAATQTVIFPRTHKYWPTDLHVEPQAIKTKAADGLEIPNQLFVPKGIKPGERRPAIIFVHGGPVRQMLLGYHYMHFYHWSYGINQWLANQGYVVLSVNYRSGVGYGRSFRDAANRGGQGNSEYQDVVAGAKYLQSRPDVDPERVGIWGLSYGGVLTAQALARNSDIFKAGVDLAGVHLWGSSLDPDSVSFKSSAIGAIEGWKSPVLLVHGDDDRNVAFQQTTGLVQLLRQRDVHYELIVFPDDTHESMLHSRWMYTLDRMEQFLNKYLKKESKITTSSR